jgi:hypothetical protein
MACGAPLKEGLQNSVRRDDFFDDDSEFDLDDRVLCPDGSCTGIIIDGRCSECGRTVGEDGQLMEQDTGPAVEKDPSEDDTAEKKAD